MAIYSDRIYKKRLIQKRAKKRKQRTTLLVVLVLSVFIASSYTIFALSDSKKSTPNQQTTTATYMVKNGDTLWDIALQYKNSYQDTREYIYDLKKLNNLKTEIIVPGQVLYVYVTGPSFE